MLITGPEICHVDRCPHGCTSETGCRGIAVRQGLPENTHNSVNADYLSSDGIASEEKVGVNVPAAVALTTSERSDLSVAAMVLEGPDMGPDGHRVAATLRRLIARSAGAKETCRG